MGSFLDHPEEVLQEPERGLARADGEVLLHFLALLAAKGRIARALAWKTSRGSESFHDARTEPRMDETVSV